MRRAAKAIAMAAGAAGAAVAIERSLFAAPRYRGPRTDHFDGERFYNHERGWQNKRAFLKWTFTRHPGRWRRWLDAPFGPPPPRRVDDGRLRVTFINHSTTLLQLDGINILTDPIWSERTSPVHFAGPRRHRPPGIRFEDLPSIDLVLVSHNHYDHLDVPTLQRLQTEHVRNHEGDPSPSARLGMTPRIVTPLGNARLMERYGIENIAELDWWGSEGNITVVPSRHFSSRALSDRNRNLWSGFIVGSRFGNVYFAGDTGWGEHFAEIGRRFTPIRLALLPIGSYLPRWFMRPVHIDPAEAVEAHLVLRARTSVAVHFGTFALGDDGEEEPVWDLKQAIARNGNPRFWILEHGEGRDIPPID